MLRQFRQIVREWLIALAQLIQERPVADQVTVTADRRREVAVGRAPEPRVAEVARVVAGALEGTQDEARKGLAATARLTHVRGDALGRARRELLRLLLTQPLGRGRRRHVERGEPREQ